MASVSVATSTTALLAATKGTTHVIIQNLGANQVWVNMNAAAVANTGFCLAVDSAPIILHAKGKELDVVFNAIAETGATEVSAYRVTK